MKFPSARFSQLLLCGTLLFTPLLFSGCREHRQVSAPAEPAAVSCSFDGTILEVSGSTLLVQPDWNSEERQRSHTLSLSAGEGVAVRRGGETLGADALEAGQTVRIAYDGGRSEGYTAQLYHCTSIEIL